MALEAISPLASRESLLPDIPVTVYSRSAPAVRSNRPLARGETCPQAACAVLAVCQRCMALILHPLFQFRPLQAACLCVPYEIGRYLRETAQVRAFGYVEHPSGRSTIDHKATTMGVAPRDVVRLCRWVVSETKDLHRYPLRSV